LTLEHTPRRPDWLCRDCLHPWPCPDRKRALAEEYRTHPVAVALYLATCYNEAVGQMPAVPVDALYARMVGWLAELRRP
jgi:hypothetical protein